MDGLDQVLTTLEQRQDESLADLLTFAAIPSVSAQAVHKPDMEKAADWLAQRLRQAGLKTVETWPTAGHAAVYAEYLDAGKDAPTILIYGHYDVQPPEPLEKWRTPPFTPTVQQDKIYGRGVSDDKGPLLIAVQAVDACLSALGRLPVNVKFLFEGEEEIGSVHLPALVEQQKGRLSADFVLSADGGMWSAETPSLTVSARGLAALEFTLRGPAKDLHSGRHGGSVQNPLHAIAALIASLHDDSGRVAVAGFYDGVSEPTPQQREEIKNLPFSDADYLAQTGAPTLYGESGYSTLERQWLRPTLELNGLWGGYTGEGSKTVLPIRGARQAHLPPGAGTGAGADCRTGCKASAAAPSAGSYAEHSSNRTRSAGLSPAGRSSGPPGGAGGAARGLRRAAAGSRHGRQHPGAGNLSACAGH